MNRKMASAVPVPSHVANMLQGGVVLSQVSFILVALMSHPVSVDAPASMASRKVKVIGIHIGPSPMLLEEYPESSP
jgi:hypothetical protein